MADYIVGDGTPKPVHSGAGRTGKNEKPAWLQREERQHGRSPFGYLSPSWQCAIGVCSGRERRHVQHRANPKLPIHTSGWAIVPEIKRRRDAKSVKPWNWHARTYTSDNYYRSA